MELELEGPSRMWLYRVIDFSVNVPIPISLVLMTHVKPPFSKAPFVLSTVSVVQSFPSSKNVLATVFGLVTNQQIGTPVLLVMYGPACGKSLSPAAWAGSATRSNKPAMAERHLVFIDSPVMNGVACVDAPFPRE